MWPDHLNDRIAAHVSQGAHCLAVFAVMRELRDETVAATGLVLTRKTAIEVSWDMVGWPLYLYRPLAQCPGVREAAVDDAFYAAKESSSGFSMC